MNTITTDKYFTEEEAKSKIGKRIVTLVAWSGVEKGTVGKVVDTYTYSFMDGGYGLDIAWDIPEYQNAPLIDGFSKDEYDDFIKECE